jgi:hypothetical protein
MLRLRRALCSAAIPRLPAMLDACRTRSSRSRDPVHRPWHYYDVHSHTQNVTWSSGRMWCRLDASNRAPWRLSTRSIPGLSRILTAFRQAIGEPNGGWRALLFRECNLHHRYRWFSPTCRHCMSCDRSNIRAACFSVEQAFGVVLASLTSTVVADP